MEDDFMDIEDISASPGVDDYYVLDDGGDRSIEDLINYELALDLLGDLDTSPPEIVNPLTFDPVTYKDYCNLEYTLKIVLNQIPQELRVNFVQKVAEALLDSQSSPIVQRVVDKISQQRCSHPSRGDP